MEKEQHNSFEEFKRKYPDKWKAIQGYWVPGLADRLLGQYDWEPTQFEARGELGMQMWGLFIYIKGLHENDVDSFDPSDETYQLVTPPHFLSN